MWFTTPSYRVVKVMFSVRFVCHSLQGCSMWPLPMMHWTSLPGTSQTWELRTSHQPPGHETWRTPSPAPTSDIWGHHWRPLHTCLLQESPTSAVIWWLLKSYGQQKWAVCLLLKCLLVQQWPFPKTGIIFFCTSTSLQEQKLYKRSEI